MLQTKKASHQSAAGSCVRCSVHQDDTFLAQAQLGPLPRRMAAGSALTRTESGSPIPKGQSSLRVPRGPCEVKTGFFSPSLHLGTSCC